MPSREEMFFLPETENNTTQDFLSRDIENLVSEIKENLRLSGFKTRHQRRIVRPSPYSNPSRSLSDCCETCVKSSCSDYLKKCTHRTINNVSIIKANNTEDDPYEMLQDLLRDGGLIKEAVRRLQKGLSPKQRYYYDSDEESSRSPLHFCRNLEV